MQVITVLQINEKHTWLKSEQTATSVTTVTGGHGLFFTRFSAIRDIIREIIQSAKYYKEISELFNVSQQRRLQHVITKLYMPQ